VTQYLGRTALSHRIFTGLQRRRLGSLIADVFAYAAAEGVEPRLDGPAECTTRQP
jgi:hypothetical protein